jgi:drug/metabolite transporter (DMT)-like permease
VVLFAATTLFARLATVSAPVLVTWRCLLAALGACCVVMLRRKQNLWPGARRVSQLLGIGVVIGLHWLCLFGAVKLANVSIALAGLATLSLCTACVEPLLTCRPVRLYEVLLGLLVLAGIGLIAGAQTDHLAGLCLAVLSALLAAIFLVLNRKVVVDGGDPMVMVGWEMTASTAVCVLAVPLFDPAGFPALVVAHAMDWLWIVLLALVCTVFAQALTNRLLRSLSAYTFNLVANFEPVYGMLAAALIFGEHEQLRPSFYLGALAIVAANGLHPRLSRSYGSAG